MDDLEQMLEISRPCLFTYCSLPNQQEEDQDGMDKEPHGDRRVLVNGLTKTQRRERSLCYHMKRVDVALLAITKTSYARMIIAMRYDIVGKPSVEDVYINFMESELVPNFVVTW